MKLFKKHSSKGFTLIELLVVIAVLGVLAAVVMVAINPAEQLARGRDAGRKSTMAQLVSATQSYYTSRTGTYPAANNTWITTLKDAGEVKAIPSAPSYSLAGVTACGTNGQPADGWCYRLNGTTEAAIWVRLESSSEDSKCTTAANVPFFTWQSVRGSSCLVCFADASAANTALAAATPVTCETTQ